MAQIVPQDEFAGWLSVFLSVIASGEPRLAIDFRRSSRTHADDLMVAHRLACYAVLLLS